MSAVKKKKETFAKATRLGTYEASVENKESIIQFKQGVRRAKSGHEKSLASRIKDNRTAFHTYIKCNRVAREWVGTLKDREVNLCVEPEEMGVVLNEYIASVFTKEKEMLDDESGEGCVDTLRHVEVKMEEVLGVLKSIRLDKQIASLTDNLSLSLSLSLSHTHTHTHTRIHTHKNPFWPLPHCLSYDPA